MAAKTDTIVIQTKAEKITSWSDIKKMAMSGRLKNLLKSGDVLPLTLSNGDKVDLVVGYDKNGKAYFIFDKAMSDRHIMNKKWRNIGYAESEMARYADEDVFPMLPTDIQQVIEPTKIIQVWDGKRMETYHKLFCLSHTQVFGYDEHYDEEYFDVAKEPQDGQIDIFKNPFARVKMRCNEETTSWWGLRSTNDRYNYFYLMRSDGSYGWTDMTEPVAVVLGFCIEPDK